METKRKTHTSTAVKRRYLDKTYVQYNVRIRPELNKRILDYLSRENISKAAFLARAIDALDKEG